MCFPSGKRRVLHRKTYGLRAENIKNRLSVCIKPPNNLCNSK
ncbi:hypothetical protein BACPLE_03415 [Phocaeicola plebeius DSM 17135]|uniref:Uncharacterized protein n=1 Tax=Phocaeicola plebeius (strain DSM 17135 / JCM 12973 / CCUG 54634 / M2) TaxID=484018 RepID=B5D324_PHOPM|nr:hypothetical protein BACPLE_03415 [Phocaeicola plebeius DSM 17135]